MESKKIFGIGAVTIMTLLVITPVIYGQRIEMQPDISVTQTQTEVEDYLGIELQLCVQNEITNGYNLIFTTLETPEDMRDIRFFEAYYIDGQDIDVHERYLEDSVYKEGREEIISEKPLVTAQSISLTGKITMAVGMPIVLTLWSHSSKTSFAKVTARGLFYARLGKMKLALDLSHEKHDLPWGKTSWDHNSYISSDKSYGEVYASASYYCFPRPVWVVGACIRQYADSKFNQEYDDWAYTVY